MFAVNNFVTAGKFFLVIAGELVLIFVAVSFVIGLLMEYLPPSRVRDFLANRLTWVQYLLGSGLGAITPFCSCSTVPITAGLLKGGVPFGPTMAFLFSSPVLNPVIIALLLSLFGLKVTVVYSVITFLGSMAMAAILSRFGMETQVKPLMSLQPTPCCGESTKAQPRCCKSDAVQPLVALTTIQPAPGCCAPEARTAPHQTEQASCCGIDLDDTGEAGRVSFKEKMKRASLSAVDTFKGVFWYLLLGAGIGAFIYGFFPQDLVVGLAGPGNPWSIPVAAVIGVPMYIRAETVIPISAALVGKGMGVGTVLALIIGGAGASIPEMIILGSMFKKKLVLAFLVNVFLVAIAAGYLVDWLVY
ncbi:MAG: permease [Syntrophorhabdaceae bacterium]|nr:permease [Syntrophorhabdaceae bacterium]